MRFGRNIFMRAGGAALVGVLALTQVVVAQDVTEYEAPENIGEISGDISTDGSSTVGPTPAPVRSTPRSGATATTARDSLALEVKDLQAQLAAAKSDRGALRMELDALRKKAK